MPSTALLAERPAVVQSSRLVSQLVSGLPWILEKSVPLPVEEGYPPQQEERWACQGDGGQAGPKPVPECITGTDNIEVGGILTLVP